MIFFRGGHLFVFVLSTSKLDIASLLAVHCILFVTTFNLQMSITGKFGSHFTHQACLHRLPSEPGAPCLFQPRLPWSQPHHSLLLRWRLQLHLHCLLEHHRFAPTEIHGPCKHTNSSPTLRFTLELSLPLLSSSKLKSSSKFPSPVFPIESYLAVSSAPSQSQLLHNSGQSYNAQSKTNKEHRPSASSCQVAQSTLTLAGLGPEVSRGHHSLVDFVATTVTIRPLSSSQLVCTKILTHPSNFLLIEFSSTLP